MPPLSAVFFDFDGVLCMDRFYTTLLPDYPGVLDWVGAHIFSGEKYCDRWMRGEYTYRQINAIISRATTIPLERLNELFVESVKQMKVNEVVLDFARALNEKHIRTALVTGNMDIFNQITMPDKKLTRFFPVIINSYDYKMMKQDENGRLFDIALDKLGLNSYNDVFLIDDSPTYCDIFRAKGGRVYQYVDEPAFKKWANRVLSKVS
jgi:FMN phosphatase YigB (HAD superfamily)